MPQNMTTVPERIQTLAAEHPDRPFVVEADGRTVSYGDFHTESLVWAAAYRSLGLGAGDNVVTVIRPSAAAYASWVGMTWL
jgi:crotonobetaine/carnitine-CoA ligase